MKWWWNFIGRTDGEIRRAREDWAAASDRFGEVTGHPGDRLPAPELPTTPMKARRNPRRPPRHH
ncbi:MULTISPECIES: hypothetical protein [unclassified Streptomyces]|uniref:hypothetical protein n=1 Tax=unclassified Streptomyces TaxID=2593676 RepID=UPI00381CE039